MEKDLGGGEEVLSLEAVLVLLVRVCFRGSVCRV